MACCLIRCGIIGDKIIGENMKNALFDELKDLKKDMAQNEKEENEKRISEIRDKKEDALKDEFLEFTKTCGINKIDK